MRPIRLAAARAARLPLRRPSQTTRSGWVCPSCHHGQTRRSSSASGGSASGGSASGGSASGGSASGGSAHAKPFYVTSPIFYVNASPHVGHMYTMILADSLKRWQTLRGRNALYCTGTDEHGMKVQRAAAKQGIPPKAFCDSNADKFRQLAAACGIDNDFFVRTTDADHMDAVQHFWHLLRAGGHVYESTHSGWYCVSDECFYAEDEVERAIVPQTGRTIMASTATGSEVEWTEEKNYHFRMKAMRDRLLQFYDDNPDWIVPRARMNEVVSWVRHNLEDLSISRPTIYVWVDALINYLTKAGFPAWAPGEEHRGGWPADVHVIGKDIVRFHGLLSHAHWTLGKKKMSKSVGNVVNPFQAIERWDLDTMRYFMLRDGGLENDADYENRFIFARYEKDLQWTLGNALSRITRSTKWNAEAVMAAAMETDLNPSTAIKAAMTLLVEANKFIADSAPWDTTKALRVAGLPARRTFAYATFGGDVEYGARKEAAALPRGKWTGLFPPAVATD
ncbi:methionine--tRNA ligase like protein [Verticillium longisporum]|uniref:Methionine--tRNA ligase like protein n=1 Tax=Verticillium longisporum TaxID=100787 RepID=A0A8I3APX8_VERLO|nr:methionine--tRNA ligase like protein [Verticillium longisporum]